MGPSWGPPGSCWPPRGPMLAPWTLLSGIIYTRWTGYCMQNRDDLNQTDTLQILTSRSEQNGRHFHYPGVIIGTIASQITSLTIVSSTAYSKNTSNLRVTGLCAGNSPGPVNSPLKWPVTRKMFPFNDVIIEDVCSQGYDQIMSTLVQVMARCRTGNKTALTKHHLKQ